MKKKLNVILSLSTNRNLENYINEDSMYRDSKLTYNEICHLLDNLAIWMDKLNIEIKLTGEELTEWQDSGKNITDIFFECSNRKLHFVLSCDAKEFITYYNVEKIFNQFLNKSTEFLKVYLTFNEWHENSVLEKYYSNVLDNFIKYKEKNSFHESLGIYVQIANSKKNKDNSLSKFIEKYSKAGVTFIVNSLLPCSQGKNLDDSIPKLSLSSNNKDTLGDYKDYFYMLGRQHQIWNNYKEFELMNNLDVFFSFNLCEKNVFVRNGKAYYGNLYKQ